MSAAAARPGWVSWMGLAVIAAAAGVLSFASVRDLAAAASYPAGLAFLLPVVIDTTAVVSSRIWLGRRGCPAVGYARALALTAAVVTIGANVVQHALSAYRLVPAWWLIAALAALPPAALVAVAHLVALLTRPPPAVPVESEATGGEPDRHPEHAERVVPAVTTEATSTDLSPGQSVAGLGHLAGVVTSNGTASTTSTTGADQAVTAYPPQRAGPPDGHIAGAVPVPFLGVDRSDEALLVDLWQWGLAEAGVPSRRRVMARYRVGTERAERLRSAAARPDRSVARISRG